jgi:Mor family transcriptional regulator
MEELKFRANDKKERNIAIYQDRLSGLSWSALIFKYQLNIKTLYSIVKRLEKKLGIKDQA